MTAPVGPALRWNWRDALFGLFVAVPGVVVIASGQLGAGLALLFGGLPAAIVGVPAVRPARRLILVIGLLFAICVIIGAILAVQPWLAVVGMFVLAVGAAELAARRPFGLLAMNLCVPIAGIGLSFSDIGSAIGFGAIVAGGTVVAFAIALCFPEREPEPPRPRSTLDPAVAARYGLQLGLVGATAAAIGFVAGVYHVGWIAGAALLVSRPSKDMARLRSVGRVCSVLVGAALAAALVSLDLPAPIIAACTGAALIGAAGIHTSRWYVVPAFTTFLALWLLLYADQTVSAAEFRFDERVIETVIGVGIAYLYGLLFAAIARRRAPV